MKALPDVFPPYTQREEIHDLGELLDRVPKRVVVLLDEIDRMQKDDLLLLLKVIRGAPNLPNLTFVCAFEPEEVETKVCGAFDARSHEFMEKFFPTTVDLPKPSNQTLEQTFRSRIIESLDRVSWFADDDDRNAFAERIDELWAKALIPVLTNLRKIGLLSSDLHAAAVLVGGEVIRMICVRWKLYDASIRGPMS